jgi:folate-binding protein YgfZ
MSTSRDEYEAWRERAAWADLGHRATVLAQGPDAVRFLDNFATAAVGALAIGTGAETFFTDSRGWVIALAVVLRVDDGLVIEAAAGLGSRLQEHLEHYHIREQVELIDASAAVASLLIAGPAAAAWLTERGVAAGDGAAARVPERLFDHGECSLGGIAVRLVHTDWWGEPGWLVRCAAEDHAGLLTWMRESGLPQAKTDTVETARIERGTPAPVDMPEKTLPQELGRDARAISFTKGCYLGQETVARLDALGHVNRRLVAVAVEGELPSAAEVMADGTSTGRLTSGCRSPRLGCGLGLGILSTKAATAAALTIAGQPARLVELPG